MEMTALEIRLKIESDFDVRLRNQSRLREYVYPRAVYFRLCREYTDLTLQELAESMNLKTHATVLRSLNFTFYDMLYENKYKNYYEKFRRQMEGNPTLEHENKLLKIKIQELENVVEGYRFKLIG
jgi:chromosomal replication initiation ATPase DnaA